MNVELKLGDKLWTWYGTQAIIVGFIVDHSPNYQMIGLSPMPYTEYKDLSFAGKANCPVTWCHQKACSYIDHLPYEDVVKKDDELPASRVGF